MNFSRLLALGADLRERGFEFAPASVMQVKQNREEPPGAVLTDLFGWGRYLPKRAIPGRLYDLMREAGVICVDEGHRAGSRVRAVTIKGNLLFHTAGPGAKKDAVFVGPDTTRFIGCLDQKFEADSIVEIGCGNCAAAIHLAQRYPQARVWGGDVNPLALQLAAVNMRLGEVPNLSLRHSDILSRIPGQFDLIVSNPPFVDDDQARTYRHGGGACGMELPARIVRSALPRLSNQGRLLMYTASPIVNGKHVLSELLADVPHTISQIGSGEFDYLTGLPNYEGVERVGTVLLTAPTR